LARYALCRFATLQLSGEWAEAYEVLRKSISVLTPFEKNAAVAYGLADLKVKLAAQLHDVGKYTEAVEYTKQAASTYTAFPSSHLLCCDATFALAACYVDTANAYLMQGDYNQCDDFCAKAMIALDHAAQDPRPNTNGILQVG
jgi:tetratricopeptide (TPR) repeat protein